MTELEEIKIRIRTLSWEAGIEILSEYISRNPDDDEALTARGMKYWGAGRRALALNDYLSAISVNPDSKARQAYKASLEILDYRNKDLYNP